MWHNHSPGGPADDWAILGSSWRDILSRSEMHEGAGSQSLGNDLFVGANWSSLFQVVLHRHAGRLQDLPHILPSFMDVVAGARHKIPVMFTSSVGLLRSHRHAVLPGLVNSPHLGNLDLIPAGFRACIRYALVMI